MVNRIVVGAHYGLRDWLLQRLTAVVMAAYGVIVGLVVLARLPMDYAAWKGLFAPQWFRLVTLVFLLSLFYHAWIGMRDILMDYIQSVAVRLSLEVLVALALIVYAFWSVAILWGV
jgi:succinate dehydrogenase / fumarate reductase, membrane anchor subunit